VSTYVNCESKLLTIYREDVSDSEPDSEPESEASASEDGSSSEDNDEPLPTIRPYSALIQSLTASASPQAKRRKLDLHQESNVDKTTPVDTGLELDEDTDEIAEEENGSEAAIDEVSEGEDSDVESREDPFDAHFANPDENLLKARLQSLQKGTWSQERLTTKTGKIVTAVPESANSEGYAEITSVSGPKELKLKQKLAVSITKQRRSFDDLEKTIAVHMFNYKDLLFCERSPTNSEKLRRLACLHAVNHVFK
jgi:U3 small nucleolar RNA-associated protein 25